MKKSNLFILLLILLFTTHLYSNESDSTSIKPFTLSEIPIQLENTTTYLAEESIRFTSESMIPSAKKRVDTIEKRFNKLELASDSLSFKNSNLVQLNNLHRRWTSLKKSLEEALKDISERNIILESEKDFLNNMFLTWEQTKIKSKSIGIPNELVSSINTLEENTKEVIEIIKAESDELLNLQIALVKKKSTIDSKLKSLKEIVLAKQKAVFDRNADPIWEQFAENYNSLSISEQVTQLLSSYANYLENFYSFYKRQFLAGIIIFLLIFTFTIGIKYYGSRIINDDPIVQKAILLLSKPLSISVLLFLLLLSFLSSSAEEFQGIRRVLMLIPLLLILLKIIDSKLKSTLYIFMFLFFMNELRVSSGSEDLLGHLILLTLTLMTYLAIFWAKRDNFITNFIINDKLVKIVNHIFNFSLLLITLVLIQNILGYSSLANVLFNGFHDSVYATILFLTANLVFKAILLIILKTKPFQKLKVVLLHSERIVKTGNTIIKVVLTFAWAGIILNSFLIYNTVFDTIKSILSTKLGYGSILFSLGDILLFLITVWISYQLSKFIQFILEVDVLPKFDLPRGVPAAITSVTKYFLLSFGLLIALMSMGVDFNKFAILIGALGVGIGFGLQNLVNNFISGIILIFERPIQIGDIIKIGEITGSVKRIGIRSSVVRSFEGADIIIPNGNLLSSELTNWTFLDPNRRMVVNVGVEYGSDVDKVKELLLRAVKAVDGILEDPEPNVVFRDFGNSSLDFNLRCWTKEFEKWFMMESELRFEINRLFKENNITIPFPQTDINFKNNLMIENNSKNNTI